MFCQSIGTNNDVEGWYRYLIHKASDRKPGFYELTTLLDHEASLILLQQKLVSESNLTRYQVTTNCKGYSFSNRLFMGAVQKPDHNNRLVADPVWPQNDAPTED